MEQIFDILKNDFLDFLGGGFRQNLFTQKILT